MHRSNRPQTALLDVRTSRRHNTHTSSLRYEVVRLRRENAALRYAATHDPLTGLLNRAGLEAAWPARPAHCWLALVDLDQFKPINDRYGHPAGDRVLVEVARRLRRPVGAVAARLGGDEFAVLLPVKTGAYARTLCQSLQAAVAEPIPVGNTELRVGASIGLAHASPQLWTDLGIVLAAADRAMYRSKASGEVELGAVEPQGRNRLPGRPTVRRRDRRQAANGC